MVTQHFELIFNPHRILDGQLKDKIENDLTVYAELC